MATNKTTANVSPEDFLRNLADSGLSGVGTPSKPALENASDAPDGVALAARYVAAGLLTRFQASAVLERRFEDLLMGNYEILDRLGAGGMGTVFKARHRRMKRVVALKLMSKELAETKTLAERFQREVEAIARLSHPNIVMAFDADDSERGPFLVMEFVDGRDLGTLVESDGPIAPADAIDCIVQAARGLGYAHDQGIVHRDVKPANLLRNESGAVKVADLGLARLTKIEEGAQRKTSLTQAGTVVGTVEYMPPEQAIDSGEIDHRADIYSLGCTLYYLLTARGPYQGGSIMAVMLKHRDAPIPSLCEARPDVPPELDVVYQRMVAKDPNHRYSSMSEVAAALELARTHLKAGDVANLQRMPQAGTPGKTLIGETTVGPALSKITDFEVDSTPEPAQIELTVVLVEQSRTQAGIIRRLLQELGISTIHGAASGKEAIAAAKQHRTHLIVSSMHLPDMTGADLARAILEDPACSEIGFVLATSEADTQHLSSLPASPRVATVMKPFDIQRLAQSIESVLG